MRVALALGGGGARGYAHVGVIEVLQERGFEIVSVSGCSIGALVGGVFAAGKFDDGSVIVFDLLNSSHSGDLSIRILSLHYE